MDQESGGHRIQRIPPTERKGRVHTSTVTVSVLDETVSHNKNFDLIDEKYFRVEWFSGTGKGGQKRNKSQSCCRVIHDPTGITEVRQGRSRENNFQDAKTAILETLQSSKNKQNSLAMAQTKKDQVGSGMRGDKRRTYRFQDDSVTDHLSNKTYICSKVMRGNFDKLWKED